MLFSLGYTISLLSELTIYRKMKLKRVFYSAYVPVSNHPALPTLRPPLLREHRLYQADWLLRFYGFSVNELLDSGMPNLEAGLDPKTSWALRHIGLFPIDANRADYEMLLRTPGIGVKSAKRILAARRERCLTGENLKRLGVVMKRARHFLCNIPDISARRYSPDALRDILAEPETRQLSLPFES